VGLNAQPIPQNQYYKPYSLVQHKGIFQKENNTYYITLGCCIKSLPFMFLFMCLSFNWFAISFLPDTWIIFILGLIFTLFTLSCCFRMYCSAIFILGPNNLTVIKKSYCNKKCTIYNPGEIERVEFTYSRKDKNDINNYALNLVGKNGYIDYVLSAGTRWTLFTIDEIEFFLYTVNTHIQTKMKV